MYSIISIVHAAIGGGEARYGGDECEESRNQHGVAVDGDCRHFARSRRPDSCSHAERVRRERCCEKPLRKDALSRGERSALSVSSVLISSFSAWSRSANLFRAIRASARQSRAQCRTRQPKFFRVRGLAVASTATSWDIPAAPRSEQHAQLGIPRLQWSRAE